ncbi:MAG: NERD domain-containing protein [Anaerolineales bacterium]|jgi:hypothetical protein
MKIIDQTAYFNPETGEISFPDRVRAIMKYGSIWITEVQAQRSIIAALDKVLDKSFTVLRNVPLADLDANIPLILIGPPGVYVIYVTSLQGTYRAKGDQWGTISGSTFKDEKPNLLTRTERMARAVQVYLQRQGYMTLTGVEAVLLCSDPGVHVDSLRPIVRVVMRDALERFAASLTQSRLVLTPEAVHDIASRILNPPKPAPPKPLVEVAAAAGTTLPAIESPLTDLPLPQSAAGGAQAWNPDSLGFNFLEATTPQDQQGQAPEASLVPGSQPPADAASIPEIQPKPSLRTRLALSRRQLILLVVSAVLELILLVVFAFLVIRNF